MVYYSLENMNQNVKYLNHLKSFALQTFYPIRDQWVMTDDKYWIPARGNTNPRNYRERSV